MDEDGNGDGEVDFHEFTIAMTGSATSTIDSASEYDVERLTKRFIEYANITQREIAIANTEAHFGPDGTMTPASALGTTETNDGASVPMSARSVGTHNTAATSGPSSRGDMILLRLREAAPCKPARALLVELGQPPVRNAAACPAPAKRPALIFPFGIRRFGHESDESA